MSRISMTRTFSWPIPPNLEAVREYVVPLISRGEAEVASYVNKPNVGRPTLPSLDGLRALSIMLVLAGHAIKSSSHSLWFRALFLHADLGVRVFFIISGFLITTLLIAERTESGAISLRLFYIRRALRILPAFFLFVGSIALLSVLGVTPVPRWYWLYVITYTVNFAPFGVWVLGHLWSLSVEEQFYLLWPLLMKSSRPRKCAAVAIMAIFASPFFHAVERFGGPKLPVCAFPLVCGPIAMGCLLALGNRQLRGVIVASKVLSDGRTLLLALLVIALLEVLAHAYLGVPAAVLQMITNCLLTLCVARLVFFPTDLAGQILNSAPLVLIGKLSYSLYLWQQVFLNPLASAPIPFSFPVNFIMIVAAACVSYWGLEVRLLGLRQKFRSLPQTVGVQTPIMSRSHVAS